MSTLVAAPGSLGVPLPLTVEEITPAWLTAALGLQTPAIEVTAVAVTEIIWGTATKVRIVATYAQDPGPHGPPAALCVKGGFDERVRAALGSAGDQGMRFEGNFFRDVATRLDVPLPRSWFADSNDVQGVLILDDLGAQGQFGSPDNPWSTDLVARELRDLAALHAQTWNESFEELGWITIGAGPVRAAALHLFSAAHWDAHFSTGDGAALELPDELRDRERLLAGYQALWDLDDVGDTCLTHGDVHLGNTYVERTGQPLLIDWGGAARCPWSLDIAYFIVGALTVEDRREHERDLLEGYLRALEAAGGPALDRDEAWLDYRRHTLHGLIWATVPAVMQSIENVAAMTERYAAAVVDHDPLGLLRV